MGKIFSFKNNQGKTFHVEFVKKCFVTEDGKKHFAYGLCDNPYMYKKPRIRFEKAVIDKRARLSTFIEEFTHAFFWEEPEWKVKKFSATLAKFIQQIDKLRNQPLKTCNKKLN